MLLRIAGLYDKNLSLWRQKLTNQLYTPAADAGTPENGMTL
jgi:hypothetical protein